MPREKDLSRLVAQPLETSPPAEPPPAAPGAADDEADQGTSTEDRRPTAASAAGREARSSSLVVLPDDVSGAADATGAAERRERPAGTPGAATPEAALAPEAVTPEEVPAHQGGVEATLAPPSASGSEAGAVADGDLLTRLGEAPVQPLVAAERRCLPLAGATVVDVWSLEAPRSPADGLRILSPPGRRVHAVVSGVVVDHTTSGDVGSEHLVIRTRDGRLHHYHELEPGSCRVTRGETVRGGDPVGRVASAARQGWMGIRLAVQDSHGNWRNPYEELVGLPDPGGLYADPVHLDPEVVERLEASAERVVAAPTDLLAGEPGTEPPASQAPAVTADRVSRLVAGLGPAPDRTGKA